MKNLNLLTEIYSTVALLVCILSKALLGSSFDTLFALAVAKDNGHCPLGFFILMILLMEVCLRLF